MLTLNQPTSMYSVLIIGEIIDGYYSEDNQVYVVLIEDNKYDSVYQELSKDSRISRIINDRQTLEDYQEAVNSGIN